MPKRLLTLAVAGVLGAGAAVGVAACGDDETTTVEDVQSPATEVTETEGDPGGAPSGTPGVGVDEGDPGGAPSGTPGVGVDEGDSGGAPSGDQGDGYGY